MENQVLAHANDRLIPGLSYTLGPTAQYVKSRQSTTFWPSGGNQYSVNGVRVLRFEIQSGGDMFLDPATIKLAFTLKNTSTSTTGAQLLQLLSNSPLSVFQRLRVLMKGTLVEDINYLHRTEHMLDLLLPPQRRKSQSLQMMGDYEVVQDTDGDIDVTQTKVYSEFIPKGKSRKVLVPLLSGLLSPTQPHWIPLKMAPLTIELEINPLVRQYLLTTAESSTEWGIEDAQIKVDLCEADAFLADKVYGMIRSSGLQFSFPSFNTTMNVLPAVAETNGQISTQFAKSYTRVKTIFVTFGSGEFNSTAAADAKLSETSSFLWPARADKDAATYKEYNSDKDKVEFQIHVGSETMPQYPIRSLAEFAYHLEKAIDLTASAEGISINPADYRTEKFIIGLDVEKAGTGPGGGAEFTGLDTSVGGGSNIRVEMKNMDAFGGGGGGKTSQVVDRVYLTLVHNVIAILEERGVNVLD